MKHIYQCMTESTVRDVNGVNYPDVLTLGYYEFNPKNIIYYSLTDTDIKRFDLLMFRFYGEAQYDDVILAYNHKYKNDLQIGDVLILPYKTDLDNYFRKNRK